jgi:hypothetical protein
MEFMELIMDTNDLFALPLYAHRNPQVEQLLIDENFTFNLVELPSSIIKQIDVNRFQTRNLDNENIVDNAYVELMVETLKHDNVALPAVVLFFVNNKYIACDGRHRLEAYRLSGKTLFVAYVIECINEQNIWLNGLRLSNMLNEMNGEKAGKDAAEKANRKNAQELCAAEMFALIKQNGNRNEVIEETLKNFHIIAPATRRATINILAKKEVQHDLVCQTSTDTAQKLVDAIANNEIQSVQAIMQRCEPEHKVKLVRALVAAKDYAASAKIVEVLKDNGDNAPSIIISALQNAAGLDENNKKMAIAERTHQANQTYLRKIFGDLFRVLTYNVPFNGQEKQAVIKDSEKLIDALKTYKNNLEAL